LNLAPFPPNTLFVYEEGAALNPLVPPLPYICLSLINIKQACTGFHRYSFDPFKGESSGFGLEVFMGAQTVLWIHQNKGVLAATKNRAVQVAKKIPALSVGCKAGGVCSFGSEVD